MFRNLNFVRYISEVVQQGSPRGESLTEGRYDFDAGDSGILLGVRDQGDTRYHRGDLRVDAIGDSMVITFNEHGKPPFQIHLDQTPWESFYRLSSPILVNGKEARHLVYRDGSLQFLNATLELVGPSIGIRDKREEARRIYGLLMSWLNSDSPDIQYAIPLVGGIFAIFSTARWWEDDGPHEEEYFNGVSDFLSETARVDVIEGDRRVNDHVRLLLYELVDEGLGSPQRGPQVGEFRIYRDGRIDYGPDRNIFRLDGDQNLHVIVPELHIRDNRLYLTARDTGQQLVNAGRPPLAVASLPQYYGFAGLLPAFLPPSQDVAGPTGAGTSFSQQVALNSGAVGLRAEPQQPPPFTNRLTEWWEEARERSDRALAQIEEALRRSEEQLIESQFHRAELWRRYLELIRRIRYWREEELQRTQWLERERERERLRRFELDRWEGIIVPPPPPSIDELR